MWQIVNAVGLLHRNELIHTDLKLENILLTAADVDCHDCDPKSGRPDTGIRLIDFGSSDVGSSWHRHLVTTRHYRAPEILMGLRWGYECDIWSIGCILIELGVGNIGFDARDVVEHLYLIQEMIGEIPKKMWNDCTRGELRQFVREGRIPRTVFAAEVQASFVEKQKITRISSTINTMCLLCFLLDDHKNSRCSFAVFDLGRYISEVLMFLTNPTLLDGKSFPIKAGIFS
jgi:dual-specificity kinase